MALDTRSHNFTDRNFSENSGNYRFLLDLFSWNIVTIFPFVKKLRTKSHKLLAASSTGRTRACLMVRNELNVFFLPNVSNENVVPTRLEDSAGELWLV